MRKNGSVGKSGGKYSYNSLIQFLHRTMRTSPKLRLVRNGQGRNFAKSMKKVFPTGFSD